MVLYLFTNSTYTGVLSKNENDVSMIIDITYLIRNIRRYKQAENTIWELLQTKFSGVLGVCIFNVQARCEQVKLTEVAEFTSGGTGGDITGSSIYFFLNRSGICGKCPIHP